MTYWSLVHTAPKPSLASGSSPGPFHGAQHLGLGLHLATPGYPSLSVSLPAYTVLASGYQPTS
ncbi:hypothetical protein M404DRAFT_28924 [Pisolithus tinctorius Marx 270]|uniref:Uncharacterized protein n=1 Tax=Pisolithus tinctorius Marx 270 TaxID=870435 RepID=A0A0C3P145_PISTI|nr:hypothetical protein M404DRAFT_28924 [Pisolithus tinctorius Marx 270]